MEGRITHSAKFSYIDGGRYLNSSRCLGYRIRWWSDIAAVGRLLCIWQYYPGLARGYLVGGIFNVMTAEWRQMMQGLLGFEGSGVVDLERVIQNNA